MWLVARARVPCQPDNYFHLFDNGIRISAHGILNRERGKPKANELPFSLSSLVYLIISKATHVPCNPRLVSLTPNECQASSKRAGWSSVFAVPRTLNVLLTRYRTTPIVIIAFEMGKTIQSPSINVTRLEIDF